MKELARNENIGIGQLNPGDTLYARYHGPDGSREVARYEITRPIVVDTLVIFEITPGELGLADGIGAAFGRKAEPVAKRQAKSWFGRKAKS